tara:strand:+ start:790 stop:987 length:198 start_codon:yes stop_codon:yes gene_type:complete
MPIIITPKKQKKKAYRGAKANKQRESFMYGGMVGGQKRKSYMDGGKVTSNAMYSPGNKQKSMMRG